ncbi:NADH dehydrogenase subunit 4 [Iris pallida]|uniref:NADH dehydrogenase subunit 4 (Plastid) n=1 Tax=Iris pallida TaxID=29817 RepID=A0AAX6FR74_IRIPA|nr:NADH dehydrogenase subunit 4 [Iris pallida]
MGLNGAILQILSHVFIGYALFFLVGTSCDRIRFIYLNEMGGISIPMPKIFTMFNSFSTASCIAGDEWFCCGISSLFLNNYPSKISFNAQNANYICNCNWNDINSYLFIIYVTSDVLWLKLSTSKTLILWILDRENYLFRSVSFYL